MKKIYYLLLGLMLVLSTALVSCSDDDNSSSEPSDSSLIEGIWMHKFKVASEGVGVSFYVFNNDRSGYHLELDEDDGYIPGGTICMDPFTYAYDEENNKIIMIDDEGQWENIVTNLTADVLTWIDPDGGKYTYIKYNGTLDDIEKEYDVDLYYGDVPSVSSSKRLASISTSDEDDSMTFSYDKNGNLVSAIEFEKEEYYEHITQYSWEGEEIIVSVDDYEDVLSYTVKNGKIVEGFDLEDGDITTFSYDSSGHLRKVSSEYDGYRCIWSDGRLSSIVEDNGSYTTSYKFYYSDEECKGFFPLLGGFIEDDEYLFRAMPQMIGAAQTALPSKVVRNEVYNNNSSMSTRTYKYTFYEDGYLKSCTETYSDDYYDDVETYYFEWQ